MFTYYLETIYGSAFVYLSFLEEYKPFMLLIVHNELNDRGARFEKLKKNIYHRLHFYFSNVHLYLNIVKRSTDNKIQEKWGL